jgi:predicted ATPase/DNA-binding SARP family transcriptional activator
MNLEFSVEIIACLPIRYVNKLRKRFKRGYTVQSQRIDMLEVKLIGTFDIQCDGKPVTLSSRAAQSLFAYLILNPKTIHRREKLAGMFWPDAIEEKARAYLRHELWLIRKALSSKSNFDYLIADDINISFNASAEYQLDVTALKGLGADASIEEVMKGLSLFQGELLPGFYEDWIVLEREHLQVVYEQKMAWLLALLEGKKCWTEILDWAERWISLGQGPEAAYRYLMTAYDALGDHAKVASTYQRCVQVLRELDLEPSEQTRALAFKKTSKLNIPIPLTSFIGREKELKEIAGLFSKSRLITLTGSGGVGKTRLAIQVVAEILELFPDGVWFLDLAPLSDPALVSNTLANLIGLRESSDTNLSVTDLLINYLRSCTALVIFDNCEHLIESCSQLVYSLLTSCENLSILATSREALRVSGEVTYRLPSLGIPNPDIEPAIDTVVKTESVRLFTARAAIASPGFAISQQNALAIAQICQRLDGIPLAIELAAARTNVLTVEQTLKRLDDQFTLLTSGLRSALPRHQTLRATIDWSYKLLSKQEQLLFGRLAIFAGGWTLEAAESVCGGNGIEMHGVLELLTPLLNKSLIVVERKQESEIRYRLLETVRQYAIEKLIESGEEENIRTRHLNCFLQFSEQAEPALRGPTQIMWMSRLKDERDNIRTALNWAVKTNVEAGLFLSGRLTMFWENLDVQEGSRWLERFTQKPASEIYPLARACALYTLARLLGMHRRVVDGRVMAQKCLDLYRICGDKSGEVDALLLLADIEDPSRAGEFCQQGLTLARLINDKWRTALALYSSGYGQSDRFFYVEEALGLFQEVGDFRYTAECMVELGRLEMLNNNIEVAQKLLDAANTLFRQLNMKSGTSYMLQAYARIAAIKGDYETASMRLQECLDFDKQYGYHTSSLWAQSLLAYLALYRREIAKAHELFIKTVKAFYQDQIEIGVAFTLEGTAGLCIVVDKPEIAAQLLGWADAMRKRIDDPRPPLEQADVDKTIAACIAKMGEVAFSDVYDEGQKMSMDEAVAYALDGI